MTAKRRVRARDLRTVGERALHELLDLIRVLAPGAVAEDQLGMASMRDS